MNTLPLIIVAVLINTAAQILLKQGMNAIGHFGFTLANLFPITLRLIVNPYVIGGIVSYVLSLAVWLMVLSRAEVSYAYPLISLGYITTCFAAWLCFGEVISLTRLAGIVVIIGGVFLITRS